MALTAEQENTLEFIVAQGIAQEQASANTIARQTFIETINRKTDMVKLAKDMVIEINRSKTADERDFSANDIITYAETLINYIESNN